MKQTGFNIVELMTIIFVIFFFISWPGNLPNVISKALSSVKFSMHLD